MKPRKPQPLYELSFTLDRRGHGDTVSLREEAWNLADALEAVAFLARRMASELEKVIEDNEDA